MQNGFLYVVSGGDAFYREAGRSVASLRRHNPGAHATLVCDASPPAAAPVFDRVITLPLAPAGSDGGGPKVASLAYKVRHMYARSPYERTCFLDSDTYVLADLQPLFQVLDYFDMAMALAPADISPARLDGPTLAACTPYNSGVIVFKKSELTGRLFERWAYWHERALADPRFSGADQETLMTALLEVPCRVCALQSTWNARSQVHERFSGPVRLIHGRHRDMDAVARAINVTSDVRVWLPGVGICLYERMGLWHHIRYWVRATWAQCRRLVRG
jgi:hypothetical protein